MIIETEPSGLLMIRYKLYFNQQTPDPEDPWILAYLQEHELAPRRELHEEHEGIPYTVLHFGQCYLGRHVTELGNIYQRGIEHTVLAQHIQAYVTTTDDPAVQATLALLDDAARAEAAAAVAAQLYETARFEATEDKQLHVVMDTAVLRETWLHQHERIRTVPS